MSPLTDAALGLLVLAAPSAVLTMWMLLLNRRDRRADPIRAATAACCTQLGLRGMVAVDVTIGILTRRLRVTLDMRLCFVTDIWRLMNETQTRLPRGATLRIVASVSIAGRRPASFQYAVVTVR